MTKIVREVYLVMVNDPRGRQAKQPGGRRQPEPVKIAAYVHVPKGVSLESVARSILAGGRR